ncbi:TPA: hypothetical protein ACG5UV_004706 [Escherichia coli]|nr:Uncharacterised protein [Escherichia coli]
MKVLIGNINIRNHHMLLELAGIAGLPGALNIQVKYPQVLTLWMILLEVKLV